MGAISQIPAGKDIPHDFNVIIEIPAEGPPIKYEVDKDSGLLVVDRFMPGAMRYPCNYGFVPGTLSQDGDPADVLVLSPHPIHPGSMVRCRPIGLLRMTDEAGQDSKILAVPIVKLCAEYVHIKEYTDIAPIVLKRISNFFEHYKDLETGKWVKVDGWDDKAAAEKELKQSVLRLTNPKGSKETVNLAQRRKTSETKTKGKVK